MTRDHFRCQGRDLGILVIEEPKQLLKGHILEQTRILTNRKKCPLTNDPTARILEQLEKHRCRGSPKMRVDRRRRQLIQPTTTHDRPAIVLRSQDRTVMEKNVHQAPVVEQRNAITRVVVIVEPERLRDRWYIALGMFFAQFAEISPDAPPQVVSRMDREETKRGEFAAVRFRQIAQLRGQLALPLQGDV